jgi:hypothetical protein
MPMTRLGEKFCATFSLILYNLRMKLVRQIQTCAREINLAMVNICLNILCSQ